MISDTIERLKRECEALVLSGENYSPMPHDIDILIEPRYSTQAKEILLKQGFIIGNTSNGKIEAQRFLHGRLFFIDIGYTFGYLTRLFPYACFSRKFTDLVRKDLYVEKFIHYLYLVRREKKYTDFIETTFAAYRHILFDPSYVGSPVFRKSLTKDSAVAVMQKNPLSLLRGFTIRALFSFFLSHALHRFKRLGSGSITAIIGPDGSGKTSVIMTLAAHMHIEVIYMGDWGFRFQSFYNLLQRGPLWVARLSYPFFYIENWFRILRARWLKFMGHTVILDRYPGFNRHMAKSDFLVTINKLMYAFFPQPDRFILLFAPASIIRARKQELSEAEISRSQENIRRALGRKRSRFTEIENVDFDDCLNKVLQVLSSETA